jgi:hypothetical protein
LSLIFSSTKKNKPYKPSRKYSSRDTMPLTSRSAVQCICNKETQVEVAGKSKSTYYSFIRDASGERVYKDKY